MNSHRNKITIKPDVTYSTSGIFALSNKLTIEKLAKTMSEYSPNLIIRFECVMFGIGCTHESALKISITNEKEKLRYWRYLMKRHRKLIPLLLIVSILITFLPSNALASALTIAAIKDLKTVIYVGQSYALPKTVDATMSNKTIQKVAVSWNPKKAVTSKTGTFVLKGTIKGYSKQVLLTLKVVQAPTDWEEIKRSLELGIVPKEIQGDYNKTITYKQYCEMLTNMISKYDNSYLPKWKKLISSAGKSNDKMLREDGILTMSYAAVLMGINNLNWQNDTDLGISQKEMDDQMKQLSWNYKYFKDWERIAYPYCNSNYMWGGVLFFAQKRSIISMKTIYPYDYESHSMHLNEPLTRNDAILAVLRFYESQHRKITSDSAKKGAISNKAMAFAERMPNVSSSIHPNWYGSSMAICDNYIKKGRVYTTKEDIAEIADLGFNYIRLMLFYKDFTEDNSGTLVFYEDVLEDIDHIVEWCAEYKIHVCIDMHELPGYTFDKRDILEDQEKYQKALQIWDVLSSRYAKVPSSLLSYNLVNEPNDYFTDEGYAGFANDMISIIRTNDKTNKLLVSDGMLGGDWSWASACPSRPNKLLSNDIMQTIHLYPWHSLNKAGFLTLERWPYEHAQSVNNYVNGETPFYIKGDFKAGTVVTLYLDTVYGINSGGSLECKADGNNIASILLDGFEVGKDNCTRIQEYGAEFGDNGKTNGWTVEFKVPAPCREISIDPSGDGTGFSMRELFIRMPSNTVHTYGVPENKRNNGFVYETGKYTTVYIHTADAYENKTSSVTINSDGSYTVENEANKDVFDYESLREYIKKWSEWSKSTGTPIMCNEFGVPVSLSEEARIEYMRSVLELFKEYDISWSIYTNGVECWTPMILDTNVKQGGTVLPADKSLKFKNGSWYDTAMLKLFREYMD